jgi:dihydrodipicolinate synthase/N-acetylneuraminate lyase
MNEQLKYTRIIVPLITPLSSQLSLDEVAVSKLFGLMYQHGALPFILGTTGEAASLPMQLKKEYVLAAERYKKTEMQLYVGISSNVLQESIDFAAFCSLHAVDAVVATLPTYFALTEKQMLHYFKTLADNIDLPLFIYNIPATTHMTIPLSIIDELSQHKNIVGLKDSERNEERMMQALSLWSKKKDFNYLLGWAAKSAVALLNGANGLVPSTANIYPEVYGKMLNALEQRDEDKMFALQKLSDEYGALYQANKTLGESIYALKLLMKENELCEEFVMPPL